MNSKPKNIFCWILLGPIKLYQHTLGRLLPDTCRFYPTCSCYAFDAISLYGVFNGGWMTIRRISKCHPLNPGGFDPVPIPEERK